MHEAPRDFSETELEEALVDLGRRLSYPMIPDLSQAVADHLQAHSLHGRLRRRFIRGTVIYPMLVVLALLSALFLLSPGARSAVASWFHLPGVYLTSGGLAPGPLGHNLELGQRVTLSEAQKALPFHILISTLPDLGRPDEVYLGTLSLRGRVSLVYRARPGMPRAAVTGAALLVTESRPPLFVGKTIPPGTTVELAYVGSDQGLWLGGRPHFMYYVDEHGKPRRETIRLAGHVLFWSHSGITLRLEGRISAPRAIAIAQSLRPVGTR